MLGLNIKQKPDLKQDIKIVNNLRSLSIDMINNAGSGHPGIALGAAPIIYTLYAKHLKFNSKNPSWLNRDRFILSCGHASSLMYANLYMTGYDISLDDLKKFRKLDSITPAHPEYRLTPGIETTTGPLGQGVANAVGVAIGEAYLNKVYEKENMIDFYTYCLCSDGDLMEGVSYEATSLAGKLGLNKLILLYDCNKICLDGKTDDTFIDDIKLRFKSINFNVLETDDDIYNIDMAITSAKEEKEKPSIIIINTTIGKYSFNEGSNKVHGNTLSEKDTIQLKEKLGTIVAPFNVSEEAVVSYKEQIDSRNISMYKEYMNRYNKLDDDVKESLEKLNNINSELDYKGFKYDYQDEKEESLRVASSKALNGIGEILNLIIGGSADVASSTKAYLDKYDDFSKDNHLGRNIRYGVREHAMGAISNGLALVGLKPFASTFLAFSDYLKPSIRMSAMMDLPVTYIFTHDSVTIGEDGATHQPVEQLVALRSIPNLEIFRPCDVNEVIGTYKTIFTHPTAIVLSRNKTNILSSSSINDVSKGGYILEKENNELQAILISSGEDMDLTLEVAEYFKNKSIGIRVISMPSIERFLKQDDEYKKEVLSNGIPIFIIERSSAYSWYRFENNDKHLFTINNFGYSASKKDIDIKTNFTVEYITEKIEGVLK